MKLFAIVLAASTVFGMKRPEFEVATVKRNQSNSGATRFNKCAGGRLVASNTPIKAAIEWAYDIFQEFSVPAWASQGGETYDIEAKAAQLINVPECKLMLQTLLEDRFKLKLHREMRETRAYVLVLDKGGSKLRQANMDNPGASDGIWIQGGKIGAKGWDTSTIARWLATIDSLGIPVVDGTGLKGFYQFKVDFARSLGGDGDKPDIFTALPEQLGLRLESKKNVAVEFVVLDHIERPTEN